MALRGARGATRALLATGLVTVVAGTAGCGSTAVEYQEVPGKPVEIKLSRGSDTPPADGADATPDDASATPTPTPGATDTPSSDAAAPSGDTGAADPAATPSPATTPSADAPAATTPAPTSDPAASQAPAPGEGNTRFDDFCEQNAGAC